MLADEGHINILGSFIELSVLRLKTLPLFLVLSTLFLADDALGKTSTLIVEISPFKGIWGHPSLSLQHGIGADWAIEYGFERVHSKGVLKDIQNSKNSASAAVVWYISPTLYGLHLSLGSRLQQAKSGHKSPTPYERQRSHFQFKDTRWVEESYSLSFDQTLGLRFYHSPIWTSSIRLLSTVLVTHSSQFTRLDGDGLATPPSSMNRSKNRFAILLFVGLRII